MNFYAYNSLMSLTSKILIGMLFGLIFGSTISLFGLESNPFIKEYLIDGILYVGGQIFISLLKLMVVPLVFFSLTSGVSSLDKNLSLGRIAGKTLGLYLITTAIAISIGLSIAVLLNPGNNLDLQTSTVINIPESPNIKDIILNIIPSNPIQAMADGNMLQIIIFSILVGIAIRGLGESVKIVRDVVSSITEIVLKLVMYIINIAPIGVFCLMAVLFAEKGLTVLGDLSFYFFIVVSALIIHGLLTYSTLLILFVKINPILFYDKIKSLMIFAFSTLISWSYYAEQAVIYLFGKRNDVIISFKFIYCLFIILGAAASLGNVIRLADALFFCMVVPNLIGVYFLLKVVKRELSSYLDHVRTVDSSK